MDIALQRANAKYTSWALGLNHVTKYMPQVLCCGHRASLGWNKVTDILTEFQHRKLETINAFGATVEIWARRMPLSKLEHAVQACRRGASCTGMVGITNSSVHGLFTSHGMSSTLCPVFESCPGSTLTQLLRGPGVRMQMVWKTLPMSFLDDKYFISVFCTQRNG